jgi:hypothetical protein
MTHRKLSFVILLGALVACGDNTSKPTPGSAAPGSAKPSASASGAPSGSAAPSASSSAAVAKGDVYFIQPVEGSKVFPRFDVVFGNVGRTIVDAKEVKGDKNKGYYVVLVDADPLAEGATAPDNDSVFSFAKGETAGQLELKPGKHKITVQLMDGDGKAYGPKLAQTLNVEVVADQGERSVEFLDLKDNAKVKSPLKVKFGVEGMKVEIAGKDPTNRTTGHHHVLIDKDPIPVGVVIPPEDANHKHYGKGQTEAEIELPKGKHKLTLQFADGSHSSYGPEMSSTITVEVE